MALDANERELGVVSTPGLWLAAAVVAGVVAWIFLVKLLVWLLLLGTDT